MDGAAYRATIRTTNSRCPASFRFRGARSGDLSPQVAQQEGSDAAGPGLAAIGLSVKSWRGIRQLRQPRFEFQFLQARFDDVWDYNTRDEIGCSVDLFEFSHLTLDLARRCSREGERPVVVRFDGPNVTHDS